VRTLGVVTVARSDFGIYRPVLRALHDDPELTLELYVSGMHLSAEFGLTVREVEQSGFPIAERVEMLLGSDTPEAIGKSLGLGTIGFAQMFARRRPDILLVLGDRFEMFAAALAALPFKIPLAHIHGGEVTEGAMDDALRHGLTKLSHLHFAATEEYARRIVQLGEEPWRVTVSGAPSLDNLATVGRWSRAELAQKLGMDLISAPLLVTFHPVTLEYERTDYYAAELLAALAQVEAPIIFTLPNADTSGRILIRQIEEFVRQHSQARLLPSLGTMGYFTLMENAAAMVGNSSSGVIEAASFRLPVVNIGTRQRGRVRAANVIDVDSDRDSILKGIRQAESSAFRANLVDLVNPYSRGGAAAIIRSRLKEVVLDQRLIAKHFHDLAASSH